MLNWVRRIAAVSTLAVVAACGRGDGKTVTVVQAAQADARFSILVEAVVPADLAATLSGPGPFTVFAPTYDTFVDLLTELGVTDQRSRMAGIVQTAILASNGVIHAIDRVILPRP